MRPGWLVLACAAAVPAAGILALALLEGEDPESRPVGAAPAKQQPFTGPVDRSAGSTPALPFPMEATTPAELREVVVFCRSAVLHDAGALRRAALESPDPLVAGNALRALGRLERVAADPELLKLLHDERPRLRQEAVLALGASGDPAAVELLAPLLEQPDPSLRPLVIQALGSLESEVAHALLEQLALEPSLSVVESTYLRAALEGRL